MENSLTKIDNLRQDIRKAEKLRRELEVRAEEAFTETKKERIGRRWGYYIVSPSGSKFIFKFV